LTRVKTNFSAGIASHIHPRAAFYSPLVKKHIFLTEIALSFLGNTWSRAFISIATAVFLRGICGAAAIGLIAYGLWKLIMFVKRQGSHFNVPQVCLALEIIANIC
jgi:hypothetical protein